MPLIDKPLAELRNYRGVNPRPADFDAYWDESLRELDAHDPEVALVPNESVPFRNTEAFDLWFTGVGGARVHAKYLRPRHLSGKAPAMVIFHGYSGRAADWASLLGYVSEGFCVAALDCRGQGGQSEDNLAIVGNTLRGHIIRGLDDPDPKKLLYRHHYLDTALLARIVLEQPEVDPARVGAFGGSQGGGLTLACAALEPRIAAASSTFPFLCDYKRVWDMDLCVNAYEELRTFFRQFDPLHEREEAIFTRLGYIDVQFLAPRIKAKVLMSVGLADTVCPPSTQFAAYNKITSQKELLIYPDFGHELIPTLVDREMAFFLKNL